MDSPGATAFSRQQPSQQRSMEYGGVYESRHNRYQKYKAKQSKAVGYLQVLLCGLGSFCTSAFGLYRYITLLGRHSMNTDYSSASTLCMITRETNQIWGFNILQMVSTGLWCSIFYLLAGGFAIGAVNKSKGIVGATIGFSVFATIFAVAQMAVAGIALLHDLQYSCETHLPFRQYEVHDNMRDSRVINLTLVALGLIEFVFSIWAGSLGCNVCCSESETDQERVLRLQLRHPDVVPSPSIIGSNPPSEDDVYIVTNPQHSEVPDRPSSVYDEIVADSLQSDDNGAYVHSG